MTPGPTRVPERVLRAGARPMIHHRTPEFSRELAVALELLAARVRHRRDAAARSTRPAAARSRRRSAICSRPATRSSCAATASSARCGRASPSRTASSCIASRRDWEHGVDARELESAARRPSARPRGRARVRRLVDRRRERRRGGRAHRAIARRARARRRRLVDRRHAVRVRRVGRRRRGHGVAEMSDVGARVSRGRCSASARGPPATSSRLPRNYWDFAAVKRAVEKARPETPGTPPVQSCCKSPRRCA